MEPTDQTELAVYCPTMPVAVLFHSGPCLSDDQPTDGSVQLQDADQLTVGHGEKANRPEGGVQPAIGPHSPGRQGGDVVGAAGRRLFAKADIPLHPAQDDADDVVGVDGEGEHSEGEGDEDADDQVVLGVGDGGDGQPGGEAGGKAAEHGGAQHQAEHQDPGALTGAPEQRVLGHQHTTALPCIHWL